MDTDKAFHQERFFNLVLLFAMAWLSLCPSFQSPAGAGQPGPDLGLTVSGQNRQPPAGKRSGSVSDEVHLYFGAEDGIFLKAEQVRLKPDPDPVAFGLRLLAALINGPRGAHRPVLSRQTKVRTFFIKADGTAFVDLDSAGLGRQGFSALSEMLAVYAIVDTLVVNLDSVEAVKILLDGRETPSLAGHVDISRPLAADMMWVR